MGAGSGIGQGTAFRWARTGARIGALSRTPAKIEKVAADIEGTGDAALPLAANVADPAPLEPAIKQLGAAYGRIDIVAAHAGVNGMRASLEDLYRWRTGITR